MATGESYLSVAFHFRVGTSTVSMIIEETTRIIWTTLQARYMPFPTKELIKKCEQQFNEKWNFPNCFGCVDGKHVRIKNPAHAGSMFHNYKQHFSIVLQGLADANCKFIAIDVGAYGRQSDGGIFRESSLGVCLQNGTLNIPAAKHLPSSNILLPYVILGDEAYPLSSYLMRPFPRQDLNDEKRIFNYRLSRARRCVECAFGILRSKWRVFGTELETNVENSEKIVKAACLLHNIIIAEEGIHLDDLNENLVFVEEHQGNELHGRANRGTNTSIQIRNAFVSYFMSPEGEVPWQRNVIS